jgi:hypothetical protein
MMSETHQTIERGKRPLLITMVCIGYLIVNGIAFALLPFSANAFATNEARLIWLAGVIMISSVALMLLMNRWGVIIYWVFFCGRNFAFLALGLPLLRFQFFTGLIVCAVGFYYFSRMSWRLNLKSNAG